MASVCPLLEPKIRPARKKRHGWPILRIIPDIYCVCKMAAVPKANKTVAAALCGEYINLCKFIPSAEINLEYETVIQDGCIVQRWKKPRKSMDSLMVWLCAWAGYESILVNNNSSLYTALSKYRLFITEQDAKYKWYAVNNYDNRPVHHKVSRIP